MTRLLVVGEQGINTGFERVVRGIVTHLHARGDYDITVRGLGYDPQRTTRRYPYLVKQVGATHSDPIAAADYRMWLDEDDPEAVLVVHDIWQLQQYAVRTPPELPIVAYLPVDAPNVKPGYAISLSAVSEAVTYTQFGAHEAAVGVRGAVEMLGNTIGKDRAADARMAVLQMPKGGTTLHGRWDRLLRYQNPENYNVVPHGFEPGVFAPRNRTKCRELFGLPADAFVVLNVGTNSPRKRLDLTIRAFRDVARARKDALLVLHCSGYMASSGGWDLSAVAHYYGVQDRLVMTHLAYPELSDEQLCSLYGCADVMVNTSGGEGYGLPSFEGAACGVPQVVPDWGPSRELWGDAAWFTPVKDTRVEGKMLSTVHACVDTHALGERLVELAEDRLECLRFGALAESHARQQHTWDEVGAAFHGIVSNAIAEPGPSPVSFAELAAARAAELRSAGADV